MRFHESINQPLINVRVAFARRFISGKICGQHMLSAVFHNGRLVHARRKIGVQRPFDLLLVPISKISNQIGVIPPIYPHGPGSPWGTPFSCILSPGGNESRRAPPHKRAARPCPQKNWRSAPI